jgi:predicted nucleic acid-binding protein
VIWYLDTSAAVKLCSREAETDALAGAIVDAQPSLVSAQLLETEMRRASTRRPDLPQATVTRLLDQVDLLEMSGNVFRVAGLLPGANLRSLDALHLAAALESGADALVAYDKRMIEAASELGLRVVSPRP